MLVPEFLGEPDFYLFELTTGFLKRFAEASHLHSGLRRRYSDVIELMAAALVESQNASHRDTGRSGNTVQLHIARTSHARRRHPTVPLRISVPRGPRARPARALHRRLRS